MGPVAGGRLGAPSEVIQNLLGHRSASTAEMALRFVVANEDVSIALSGMENLAMPKENVAVASLEGALTGEELAQIKRMLDENKKLADLYCTGCNYCQPCPKGVGIAKIFQFMNLYRVYGVKEYAKGQYQAMRERKKENEHDASYCISCGQCEKKCPQKIAIMKQLQECDKILEVDSFVLKGNLHDLVELEKEVNDINYRKTALKNIMEIEEWCKEQFDGKPEYSRRTPRTDIKGIKTAKEERELRLGKALNKFKQRTIWENYQEGKEKGLSREKIKQEYGMREGEIALVERYERIIEEYDVKKKITGQSIGQVSYTATVQECDEAQTDLNKLIHEQQEITQKD